MIRNTLKRVMLGYVLVDHVTGEVFDGGINGKLWKRVTSPTRAKLLTDWRSGEIIGQNVKFKPESID